MGWLALGWLLISIPVALFFGRMIGGGR